MERGAESEGIPHSMSASVVGARRNPFAQQTYQVFPIIQAWLSHE